MHSLSLSLVSLSVKRQLLEVLLEVFEAVSEIHAESRLPSLERIRVQWLSASVPSGVSVLVTRRDGGNFLFERFAHRMRDAGGLVGGELLHSRLEPRHLRFQGIRSGSCCSTARLAVVNRSISCCYCATVLDWPLTVLSCSLRASIRRGMRY